MDSKLQPDKTKIGFIGTGVMGGGMAANLLKNGYRLTVYNRTKAKAEPLLQAGARWAGSVAQAAADADVVITMVSYPKDVEQVYFGPDGVLAHAKPGAFVVDMTTSSPKLARRIARAAEQKGLRALDAPVSGGDVGARDAKLCIMAGGEEAAFRELMPVFSAMGRQIVYQGPAGAGQECKMCNQIAIASNILGVCEALAYARRAGLSRESVLTILSSGGAASWQLSAYAPRIFRGDYAPGFYVKHFVKDMRIALEEADAMGLQLPALQLSKSIFDRLMEEGLGDEGTQALYRAYDPDAPEKPPRKRA